MRYYTKYSFFIIPLLIFSLTLLLFCKSKSYINEPENQWLFSIISDSHAFAEVNTVFSLEDVILYQKDPPSNVLPESSELSFYLIAPLFWPFDSGLELPPSYFPFKNLQYPGYLISLISTMPVSDEICLVQPLLYLLTTVLLVYCLFKTFQKNKKNQVISTIHGCVELFKGRYFQLVDTWKSQGWQAILFGASEPIIDRQAQIFKAKADADSLIRAFVTQDAETGFKSCNAFEVQFRSLLEETNAHGVVMLVRLPEGELFLPHKSTFIKEPWRTLIDILSSFVNRYPSAIVARYLHNDFAILLPYSLTKEAESMASWLVNAVKIVTLSADVDRNRLIFIGVCPYHHGQALEHIMYYTEQALRIAELQNCNDWAVYDNHTPRVTFGSLRWRVLLEQMLATGEGLQLYQQPCFLHDGQIHHRSIRCLFSDGEQSFSAGEFIGWLKDFKLLEQFERRYIGLVPALLRNWSTDSIAVQVNSESLLSLSFREWLYGFLDMLGQSVCQRMIIELDESQVSSCVDELQPIITQLRKKGCRLGVTQVGLTVVDTSYLAPLSIETLKLYSGLVRHIDRQLENQLIIDSLNHICEDIHLLMFATDLCSRNEWDILYQKGFAGGQGELFATWEAIPNKYFT